MKKLITIIFFLAVAVAMSATTRYVSLNGNNTDGLSWANAKTALPTSGVNAGDLVYIDGGASGGTMTYNLSAYWVPPSGSAGNPIKFQVGQDPSHNGTAIFNYTGGSPAANPAFTGCSYVQLVGDAGDLNCHFKLAGFTVVCSNLNQMQFAFIDFNGAGAGQIYTGAGACNGWEIAYCKNTMAIAAEISSAGYFLNGTFQGSSATDNKIHDNNISVYYGNSGGMDAFDFNGSGWSFYNNTVSGYRNNSYTGGGHMDGLQVLNANAVLIYRNHMTTFMNYCIYLDAWSGDMVNVSIYDNLCDNADSVITSGSPAGIIAGTDHGWTGHAAPVLFTNVFILNNIVANLGANQVAFALNNTSNTGGTPTSTTFTNCFLSNNIMLDSGGIDVTNGIGSGAATAQTNVSVSNANGATNFTTYTQYGGASNLYTLKAGASTLIHTGTNVQGLLSFTDYLSAAWANPPSVGAYEYTGASAPTLASATLDSAGTSLTVVFSASVTTGAGGSGGMKITIAGTDYAGTYSSGSGSTTYVFTVAKVYQSATATITYTGNGLEATSDGTDVTTFTAQAVTNSSTQVIPAPTSPSATKTGQSTIDVGWTDGSAGVTSFIIYRSLTNGSFVQCGTAAAGATVYHDTGLAAGTQYYYVVASTAQGLTSSQTSSVNATTDPSVAPNFPVLRNPAALGAGNN